MYNNKVLLLGPLKMVKSLYLSDYTTNGYGLH